MSTQCHEHDIHCLVVWAKCAADSMCFHWLSFSDAINRGCLSFWCGMLPDATVGTDKFHSGEMDWWFHDCYSWTNVFNFKLPFFSRWLRCCVVWECLLEGCMFLRLSAWTKVHSSKLFLCCTSEVMEFQTSATVYQEIFTHDFVKSWDSWCGI